MRGKVAFCSREISLCVELGPCKWVLGSRAWESCEKKKNKGAEKPWSFWERGPCLCLLELIWPSVCLREMPLGERRLAYSCCVQNALIGQRP